MGIFDKKFLGREDESSLVSAIQAAEKNTSGEIRVHFAARIGKDVFSDAKLVFEKLKMHMTEQRNGVLIYIVPSGKQFAIIGDEGINNVIREDFWETVRNEMQEEFAAGRMLEGIVKGIREVAVVLKSQFPYADNDKNELSDEISYGD